MSFPALDPEPPLRPLWRRALAPVAVVAGVAIVVVLALTLPGAFSGSSRPSQGRATAWPAKVTGEVIGWDASSKRLLAMTPTGKLRQPSTLADNIPNAPWVAPSGGALLSGTGGQYFLLENHRLQPGPPNFPPGSFTPDDTYGVSPFAGHENYVVVGGDGLAAKPQTPVVISLYTGNRRSMPGAPADQVVGDPASDGAWVSVAHGLPTGTDQNPQQPDSRIEHRQPHHAPVTLATAAQLARAAKLHGAHLELTPYPSPSGRLVAVDVATAGTSAAEPEAVVVLTRTGRVVGRLAATGLQQLAWSSDGSRLLIVQSPGGVTTWAPGPRAPAPAVTLPSSPEGWGSCVFSPFTRYVVCAGFNDDGSVTQWALIRLSDRALVTEPASQVPVDWSP